MAEPRRVMVRYRVKGGRAEENADYVRAVFAELERAVPAGLRYASFVAADGVTFTHLASIETDDGTNPLVALDAFRAFTRDIASRCDEPPTTTELTLVGGYRLFD